MNKYTTEPAYICQIARMQIGSVRTSLRHFSRRRKQLALDGERRHLDDKRKPEVQTVRPKGKRAPRWRRNYGGV